MTWQSQGCSGTHTRVLPVPHGASGGAEAKDSPQPDPKAMTSHHLQGQHKALYAMHCLRAWDARNQWGSQGPMSLGAQAQSPHARFAEQVPKSGPMAPGWCSLNKQTPP